MPKPPPPHTTATSIKERLDERVLLRLPIGTTKRAKALAERLEIPGVRVTPSLVFRQAVLLGLSALEYKER